jgi:hypothetical protein
LYDIGDWIGVEIQWFDMLVMGGRMMFCVVICKVLFYGCPVDVELFLLDTIVYPVEVHTQALLLDVVICMPQAVELLVCTGVGGCGYPFSSSVVCMMVAFIVFLYNTPISASDAKPRTVFMARTVCLVLLLDLQFPIHERILVVLSSAV